jgi:hypothetical protein
MNDLASTLVECDKAEADGTSAMVELADDAPLALTAPDRELDIAVGLA